MSRVFTDVDNFHQEWIKGKRVKIPYIGLIPKIIPFKLALDHSRLQKSQEESCDARFTQVDSLNVTRDARGKIVRGRTGCHV